MLNDDSKKFWVSIDWLIFFFFLNLENPKWKGWFVTDETGQNIDINNWQVEINKYCINILVFPISWKYRYRPICRFVYPKFMEMYLQISLHSQLLLHSDILNYYAKSIIYLSINAKSYTSYEGYASPSNSITWQLIHRSTTYTTSCLHGRQISMAFANNNCAIKWLLKYNLLPIWFHVNIDRVFMSETNEYLFYSVEKLLRMKRA